MGAYLTSMGTYLYNIGLGEKSVCLCYTRHCVIIYAGCYGNHCRPTVGYLLKSFWDSAILWELSLWLLPVYYGMASGDNTGLCPFYSVLFQCGIFGHWHSLILWHIQHWISETGSGDCIPTHSYFWYNWLYLFYVAHRCTGLSSQLYTVLFVPCFRVIAGSLFILHCRTVLWINKMKRSRW